jgi:hypothetical protein
MLKVRVKIKIKVKVKVKVKLSVNLKVKVKVTFPLEQVAKVRRGSRVMLYSFLNLGARWGGWSTPHPGLFTRGKTRSPLYRRLGGPQGRSGQVRKISPPLGFDPRTVQPFANLYTVYAISAPCNV